MRKFTRKTIVLVVSLVLLLTITVGGTLAYLMATSGPIENTFTPSRVTTDVDETISPTEKKDVKITNTGDTQAYIRAAVVVTWQNSNGDVYGQKPIAGTDYEITYVAGAIGTKDCWVEGKDGYYYYTSPVDVGASTGILIKSCTAKATAPEGYNLCVEILGSGIQSVPAKAVEDWSNGLYTVAAVGTADAMLKAN